MPPIARKVARRRIRVSLIVEATTSPSYAISWPPMPPSSHELTVANLGTDIDIRLSSDGRQADCRRPDEASCRLGGLVRDAPARRFPCGQSTPGVASCPDARQESANTALTEPVSLNL